MTVTVEGTSLHDVMQQVGHGYRSPPPISVEFIQTDTFSGKKKNKFLVRTNLLHFHDVPQSFGSLDAALNYAKKAVECSDRIAFEEYKKRKQKEKKVK